MIDKDTEIKKMEEDLEAFYFRGKKLKEEVPIQKMEKIKKEEAQEEFNIAREIVSTILYVFAAVAFTFAFVNFVGERTLVSGSSMESTLSDADQLYLDKLSYRLHDPERFDVIVFPADPEKRDKWVLPFRKSEEIDYIKRIIGLPGETVFINEKGEIYVDDKLLFETHGREVIQDPGAALYGVTLGEDEYFVLGDNRNNSLDSRFASVGNIKRENILGKAQVRLYPFNEVGSIYK